MKQIPRAKLYLLIFLTVLLVILSNVFERHASLGLSEKMTNFIAGAMMSLAVAVIIVFFITAFNVFRARSKK